MQASKNQLKLINVLGKLVKKYRENKNKTIYTIATECGIPVSTWRDFEVGVSKDIKLTTLYKISEGLEISFEKLINETISQLDNEFTLIDEE